MNSFYEKLKDINVTEENDSVEKVTLLQQLKNKFYSFKTKIVLLKEKLFSKEELPLKKENLPETIILVDMGKVEYLDLKNLLVSYDDSSQLYLIARSFNKFDKERVAKLPYGVKYIQVEKKVSTGKKLKIVLKELRAENRYKIITIKGRGRHLLDTYMPLKEEKQVNVVVQKKRWTPFQNIFNSKISYPTLEDINKQKEISKIENHLILWDIENISYKNVDKILSKLEDINSFYCVTVEPLGLKVTKKLFIYILRYNIKMKVGHLHSDTKIVEIIEKEYKKYSKITIISSDTDFAPIIKKLLREGKKVQIISRDNQKKGILMKNNIGDKNLKIITI